MLKLHVAFVVSCALVAGVPDRNALSILPVLQCCLLCIRGVVLMGDIVTPHLFSLVYSLRGAAERLWH